MAFISYAQNFEDVMLRRALQDVEHGFYIDVGAADPVDMSVTKTFYDGGWHGINIEPTPDYFKSLRAERPEDINLEIAIGVTSGQRIFYDVAATGLSTLDAEIAAIHATAGYTVTPREVKVRTLAEVCADHAMPDIHFLKIDVEGAEGEVLAGADFKNYRPWIVLLEATKPLTRQEAAEWEPVMLAADYIFVWFDGLNRFYIAQECHKALNQHFRLPPNSFDNFDKYEKTIRLPNLPLTAAQAEQRLIENTNEIRLLQDEVALRMRMRTTREAEYQSERAMAHEAKLQFEHATILAAQNQEEKYKHNITLALRQQADGLAPELDRLAELDHLLNHLIVNLTWKDGPRAVKIVLPLARVIRRIIGIANRIRRPHFRPQQVAIAKTMPMEPPLMHSELTTMPSTSDTGKAAASDYNFPTVNDEICPVAIDDPYLPQTFVMKPRRAVHQFHPGGAYGDAVTNSMLLTQKILRNLGYRSEIYVEYRDKHLSDKLLLLADLPLHDEYVLIVLHTLGYDKTEAIAALPAPKVLMYHNITPAALLYDIPFLADLSNLGREQLDYWRPRVAGAIAVSEYNALELHQRGYENVLVCPLLFDIDELRAVAKPGHGRTRGDPFTIIFVGRILNSKGQAELVDAFGAFNLRYGYPCRLVLIGRTENGDGSYMADLYQRIAEQGLRRIVIVTGHIPDEEVAAWYDRADLYVSLSQHEGFGVPLIEAMAHHVPVLAYAAGAVAFTMQENGLSPAILHSRDANTVASAILNIATDKTARDSLIKQQQNNLERFKLSRHIDGFVSVLSRAGAISAEAEFRSNFVHHLGFTIAGHFNGSYSLASVNRSLALALADFAPGRVAIHPVESKASSYLEGGSKTEQTALRQLVALSPPKSVLSAMISQHYPVYVPSDESPKADLQIAYFFWEESLIPSTTVEKLNENFVAVFAPSSFVVKTLIDSGVRLPIRNIGYAPQLGAFLEIGKQRLADNKAKNVCEFLHISSGFPRKGIDLLIAAFLECFSNADRVRLVIKTFPNPHNETAAQIATAVRGYNNPPDILLIDQDLDETGLLGLYAQADIAVFPTRGEGFNIPVTEALAAGLAVIVTGAGGHMDYLKPNDANFLASTVAPSRSHFSDQTSLWFEPDVTALTFALRASFEAYYSVLDSPRLPDQSWLSALDRDKWARGVTEATADVMVSSVPKTFNIAMITSWNVRCGIAEYSRYLYRALYGFVASKDQLMVICDDRSGDDHTDLFKIRPGWSLYQPDTAEQLARIVSQEDPDILIVQHQPGLLEWPCLAALLIDQRLYHPIVIVTLHAPSNLLDAPPNQQDEVLAALSRCDRVVVHTAFDVNMLNALGLRENVVYVPHGAPRPTPRLPMRTMTPDQEVLIGSYGFLLPPKGLGTLIAAIPEIRRAWPLAKFRFVNALYPAAYSAEELANCKTLASSLKIDDCIEWVTDFLPHEDSNRLLKDCDLIVLPYQRTNESSSAALRLALASGTPVAVTPLPIFDEACDAVYRFGENTPQSISEGVIALLSDQSGRQILHEAAEKWLSARAWDIVGRRMYGMMLGLALNRTTISRFPQLSDEQKYGLLPVTGNG